MEINKPYKLLLIALWIIFISIILVLIWSINKGFDFSDEGFNMLSLKPEQEGLFKPPVYFLLGKITHHFFTPDILFWRASRLLLLLLSATIFYFGCTKWIRASIYLDPSYSLNFFYPIIGIATLMNYSILYQGLSYNSITLIIIQVIAGLYLYLLSINQNNNAFIYKTFSIQFSIGVLVYLLFLTKFTSGILAFLLLSFLFVFLFFRKETHRHFTILYLSFLFGIVFFATIITYTYYSPLEILQTIKESVIHTPGHGINQLLNEYLNSFGEVFFLEIYNNNRSIIIGSVLIAFFLRNNCKKLLIYTLIILFLFMLKNVITYQYYKSGAFCGDNITGVYRMLLVFSLLLVFLISIDSHLRNLYAPSITNIKSLIKGSILLLLLPIICSFGTNNPLAIHLAQFIFSWIIFFILLILILFSPININSNFFKIFIFAIIVHVSFQIINGSVYHPYRLNRPLTEQKFNVPNLYMGNKILFDSATYIFVKTIQEQTQKHVVHSKNQPMLSLYNHPGLVYMLEGTTPGYTWYRDPGYENYAEINCYYINSSQMKSLQNTILLIENDSPVPEIFKKCLRTKGILFPENYNLIDSIQKPGEKGKLLLYIPKH